MDGSEILLPEVIQQLRSQLQTAIEAGSDEDLVFGVGELELELQVIITKGGSAKGATEGGLKFWVLNAGAKTELSGSYESKQIQKIRLKLHPKSKSGRPTDLAG